LFAEVCAVEDLAVAVVPERLLEIIDDLSITPTAVVQALRGPPDKFNRATE